MKQNIRIVVMGVGVLFGVPEELKLRLDPVDLVRKYIITMKIKEFTCIKYRRGNSLSSVFQGTYSNAIVSNANVAA